MVGCSPNMTIWSHAGYEFPKNKLKVSADGNSIALNTDTLFRTRVKHMMEPLAACIISNITSKSNAVLRSSTCPSLYTRQQRHSTDIASSFRQTRLLVHNIPTRDIPDWNTFARLLPFMTTPVSQYDHARCLFRHTSEATHRIPQTRLSIVRAH